MLVTGEKFLGTLVLDQFRTKTPLNLIYILRAMSSVFSKRHRNLFVEC